MLWYKYYRCGLIYYRTPDVGSNEAYGTSLQATYHNLYNYDGSVRWLLLIDHLHINPPLAPYSGPPVMYQSESNAFYVKMNSAAIKTEWCIQWEGVVKGRASLWKGGTFSVADAINIPSQEKGKYIGKKLLGLP